MSFLFVGSQDYLQFWSSFISLVFSLFGFLVLFFAADRQKQVWSINYVAWIILSIVTLLELVFLISLLINANAYVLVKTSYNMLRVDYLHTFMQMMLLFGMGIVGMFTLLVTAVASQRLAVAANGKIWFSLYWLEL